jgi:hypothetical protein
LQVLHFQASKLADACSGDCGDLDQATERAIDDVGSPDQLTHLGIGENDVTRLAGIGQGRKADLPCRPIAYALVAIGR